jgi:SAM-dependent MidA family methyltransferase
MADMMRAAGKVRPEFPAAAEIVLIESSPALREVQARTLSHLSVRWLPRLALVEAGPLFLVANEFFDALPIRQFVRSHGAWHERMVIADGDSLRLALAPGRAPVEIGDAAEGCVIERNPAAAALMGDIAARITRNGGLALVIDYGHADSGTGDTLQAVRAHRFTDVLAEPGEADLTAHVDFGALKHAAMSENAAIHGPVTQGAFLTTLGITARAERLRQATPDKTDEIDASLRRLTAPEEMGTLFKVMAVTAAGAPAPPGFSC